MSAPTDIVGLCIAIRGPLKSTQFAHSFALRDCLPLR